MIHNAWSIFYLRPFSFGICDGVLLKTHFYAGCCISLQWVYMDMVDRTLPSLRIISTALSVDNHRTCKAKTELTFCFIFTAHTFFILVLFTIDFMHVLITQMCFCVLSWAKNYSLSVYFSNLPCLHKTTYTLRSAIHTQQQINPLSLQGIPFCVCSQQGSSFQSHPKLTKFNLWKS